MPPRKGPLVGSGGQGKKRLAGRGPTPKAEERTGHPAARRAAAASRRAATSQPPAAARPTHEPARRPRPPRAASNQAGDADVELVPGRNAVAEALRARIPAEVLYVAVGLEPDERVTESLALARKRGLEVQELPRADLDRLVRGVTGTHQGLVLQVPPYSYLHPDDLLARSLEAPTAPLLVALDGVTDPRNLGAVVRSTAAFGGHGVIVPERRAAGMTAAAWRTSAGAAARIPVARATNLTRTLVACQRAGLFAVGLAADGELSLDDLDAGDGPVVLVVGSEGRGLSRLVGETCDLRVRIPMAGPVESLNAGVAAGVALAEVARRRRAT